MRYLIALMTGLIICAGVYAQDSNSQINNDLKDKESQDRFIVELNYTGWAKNPPNVDTKWYNRGINMFLMYDVSFGDSKNFSVAPGMLSMAGKLVIPKLWRTLL